MFGPERPRFGSTPGHDSHRSADLLRSARGQGADVWLTTVVARVSLTCPAHAIRGAKEPIGVDRDGPEREALLAYSIGLALLIVLETVSPPERLAVVLHDMFRRALRRDLADRRPLSRGDTPAGQPSTTTRPGRVDGPRRRHRHTA